MGLRDSVAHVLFRINPYWDEIGWNRQQDKLLRAKGISPRKMKARAPFCNREVHVVVVPQELPVSNTYVAGDRDLYFEAMKSLQDLIGTSRVSTFNLLPTSQSEDWQLHLVDFVRSTRATHVITHIETDPVGAQGDWTWDQAFARLLDSGWDGALLGVNFDSAYKWIRARSRRLARMSPQFVAVDICMPMDGELVSARVEVGPVNMPVSRESIDLVDSAISGVVKTHDVSFIGALYPYRVELIASLRAQGLNVAVNPHRSDVTADFESSRANQPSWLEYMRGLASSHMTINFSQSSAGPFEQLKTRVLEAGLAGTYLLTDDKDRTRLFFESDEFSTFDSVKELPELIASLLVDRAALDARARKAQVRARELAVTDFWTRIDQGLRARGLPRVLG